MSPSYCEPTPIAGHHVTERFECGSSEQTKWLREQSKQSNSTRTTRVFVVTLQGSDEVVAYYAWCMASLDIVDAPDRLRSGAGRYPQPVALLARLGVDLQHERRGIGSALLKDAILRLVSIDGQIGCRGLLIHAEDIEAKTFYQYVIPELEESPTDDLHLVLLMKDAKLTLLGR